MKLLWRGEWIETPGYEVPADGVLIGVTATVPLFTLKNASGRQQRRPGRKVAVFLYTDGPRITLRKARTKREEPRFTGDFRVTLVLGDALDSGRRVVALASRVPSCAHQFVVHRDLVLDVPASFSEDDLRAAAARLIAETETLTRLCRQGYLYSATRPPAELVELLTDAVTATGTPAQGAAPGVLRPPALP
ncbi:hypothetical protein, partial [Trebonia sp.]